MNKLVLILLFYCLSLSVKGQDGYKYSAGIKKVDSPGFYKISLLPSFVAKSEASLRDLRLMDNKGRFIPYVNASNVPVNSHGEFVLFPQVSKGIKTDSGTSIVVENTTKQPINRLWVKLKNTAVVRTMNLSGSDDLSRWFAIEEGLPLEQSNLNTEGTFVQSLSFPASSYRYLKILVNDKNKTPVRFLAAGIYTSMALNTTYLPILPVSLIQIDSVKASFITIKLEDKYQLNKLQFSISGPKYYKRHVAVYDESGKVPVFVTEVELNSANGNSLLLSVKSDHLLLKIDNADNLPLKITGAQAWQADQYIISYLDAGQSYQLLTGNANADEPEYDLKFFTDSIKAAIPGLSHQPVIKNPAYHLQAFKITRDYTVLIWVAIIVALLLLILLTRKMLAEVKDR